ncbi:MAG: Ribonuclease HII [Candidatus Omnitrophica bacterium]|nr:Ribonuclease HII [Candidatus Omnitrophota bacterium]
MDEAGRGPLAGPVVASAVIVRGRSISSPVRDSKLLTERQRERAYAEILANCRVGVGLAEPEEIDRINILQATLKAMQRAVAALDLIPSLLLVDGLHVPQGQLPAVPLVDGDARSYAISCASIIAKVTRDRMMREYDTRYPGYGFAGHKGYGTRPHIEALKKLGPCPIHRRSFEPIRSLIPHGNPAHH